MDEPFTEAHELLCVRGAGIYLPYSEPEHLNILLRTNVTSEAGALEFLFSAIKRFTLRVMGRCLSLWEAPPSHSLSVLHWAEISRGSQET